MSLLNLTNTFVAIKERKKRGGERGDVVNGSGQAETYQGRIGWPSSPPLSRAESWQQRARREKR